MLNESQFDEAVLQHGRRARNPEYEHFRMSDLGITAEHAPETWNEERLKSPHLWRDPEAHQEFMAKNFTETMIPMSELHAPQETVHQGGVKQYFDRLVQEDQTGTADWQGESLDPNVWEGARGDKPTVQYVGGKHYIDDGHHRIAAMKLAGMKHASVALDRRSPWAR